jgi:hypothetical protein
MSTTAEDISTTLSEEFDKSEPSVDATDTIAELLVGTESDEDDKSDDEDQTTLSNLSDEESDELSDAEDDEPPPGESSDAEGDQTWEGILGVSDGDLSFDEEGNIVGFNTKVNGETETVSAKNLLVGYQNNKSFTQKSQAHAEEVKAFNIQKEQVEQVYTSKLESVDALVKYFEKQLIAEYDGINWEQLRSEDPAEYAASRSDFTTKATEIQRIQEAIQKDMGDQQAEKQRDLLVARQEHLKQQFDLMVVNNPEWSDEKVRNAAKAEFKTFVNEQYGFTDQEFETVFDARLIELIKDAKRFHEAAKVADKKRQKPVPKFQKSVGGKGKPKHSQLDKLTAASKKAKGANKRDLQTSAVAELLTGNI